jgi:ComF family protein
MPGRPEQEGSPKESWLAGLIQGFIDLIYPPSCALCGRISSAEICRKCRSDLIPLGGRMCAKCGNPSAGDAPCPYCIAAEFHFDSAASLYFYEEPLRDAILDFKYHRAERKGKALAALFAEGYGSPAVDFKGYDMVVPVPLTQLKMRRRSYNQSEVLAQAVADASGVPLVPYALVKKRETKSQTGFDLRGRMVNVEGSFSVPDQGIVRGKRILLVDDIITTGATASECAKALKEAGARKVVAVSLARGMLRE